MKNNLEKSAKETKFNQMAQDQNTSISNVQYHNNCVKCEKLFWTDDGFQTVCNPCINQIEVNL
jgi:hypothetical protein